ncbi:amino acid adenylation domain-containing protein [Photobacterium halotolerans]|uniref:amino acid adenylation domain-containing protein n=1 Tax=Photobacterium halotolerans TaxID=265726 RepID=UPI0013736C04|nr:amino acid adenylation domain-containing protein [Photobacterium halotolerans]NAX48429.1 amino acid adenylation domain-containing protein [Photobacterium halotolerans]
MSATNHRAKLRAKFRAETAPDLAPMLEAALIGAAESGRVAIDFGEQSISYRELLAEVSRVQQQLNQAGLQLGHRVGIHVERSPTLIATLLACLFSGVAFVPLDPLFPAGRLRDIADEAQLDTVLETGRDDSAPIGFCCPVLSLEPEGEWPLQAGNAAPISSPLLRPHTTAYMMFTSGSTGKPKGVVISHQALSTFLCAALARLNLDAGCHWLLITTIAFDISMLEIFAPLLVGGRLRLTSSEEHKDPHAVAAILARYPSVNTLQATPTFWRMLVNTGWQGQTGLTALTGGEALDRGLAQQLLSRCAVLWNCYGPTEATVWSLMAEVQPDQPVTIGCSLAGYGHLVLDDNDQPVAVGQEGELCIYGDALSDGYWQRVDLTERQFITRSDGLRYYRTGDHVRRLADDSYQYFGRLDGQVKLRGYRIELGEIEARLRGLAAVRDAAVTLEGEGEQAMLVAYLEQGERSEATSSEMTRLQLRKALAAHLPGYMIPGRFVWLARLPTTASGKVDRKQLAAG